MKMTNRRIRLAIWILKKGETTYNVANDFKVSGRRISQLIRLYKETGEYPVLNEKTAQNVSYKRSEKDDKRRI